MEATEETKTDATEPKQAKPHGWVDVAFQALAQTDGSKVSDEDKIFLKSVSKRRRPDEDGERDESLSGKELQRIQDIVQAAGLDMVKVKATAAKNAAGAAA